jgi:RimJ/RimL family protein N-acetyltransferase
VYGQIVEGSCFRLRPPRLEDAEAVAAWIDDPVVTEWLLLRRALSVEGERDWIRKVEADPNSILWVIEHEGRAIGTSGINAIDWENQHGSTGTLIGDRSAWGRGIGGESMRLRADYAFLRHPFGKLKSGFIEGNEASRRAQLGAGYREVGRLHREHFRNGRWVDHVVTELMREDWERLRRARADATLPSDG